MVTHLADTFPTILVSATASVLLAPLVIWRLRRMGWMDVPQSAPHKLHRMPTPVAGGLVLLIAVFLPFALLGLPAGREIIGMLIGAVLLTSWGLLDDRVGLRPYQKLIGQLAVTAILIWSGVQVQIMRLPGVDLTITVIWMIGLMNAFNFVDSMDGLALGLAAVASGFFMLVTIDSGQPELAALSAGILGASVGAYVFNSSPARMFLGDSGSQLLGFLLAALGIAYVPAGAGLPQAVSWFTPIVVLGVPIFDTTLVVTSRLWHRQPVYQGAQDHTYHRLVKLGVAPTRSVVLMHFVAIVLGLIAFIALDATVVIANVIFGLISASGLAVLVLLERLTPVTVVDGPARKAQPTEGRVG